MTELLFQFFSPIFCPFSWTFLEPFFGTLLSTFFGEWILRSSKKYLNFVQRSFRSFSCSFLSTLYGSLFKKLFRHELCALYILLTKLYFFNFFILTFHPLFMHFLGQVPLSLFSLNPFHRIFALSLICFFGILSNWDCLLIAVAS